MSEANTRDKVIDATGLTLLPEGIDPQAHFCEPGLEYKQESINKIY